ncbi:MAG: cation:proton antiporter [Pseudonocardiaceae bacterium]
MHSGLGQGGLDTLARFLLAISIIVLCSHLLGAAIARFRQPRVVGEIAGGLLIGPSALGAVWPSGQATLFTPEVLSAIDLVAQLGLVLFMLQLGAELRVDKLRGHIRTVGFVVAGATLLPFLAGLALAPVLRQRLVDSATSPVTYTLFLGLALSITALPVLARILEDFGLSGTRLAALALTCAAIGDLVAWATLTLIFTVAGIGSGGDGLTGMLTIPVFVAFVLACVRPLLAVLMRYVARLRGGPELMCPLLIVGAVGFASATHTIGLHPVIGALLFGMITPRDLGSIVRISAQLHGFTVMILLPLFFAKVGLSTSVTLIGGDWENWLVFVLVLLVAIVSKFAGTIFGARLAGLERHALFPLGALMNCRGVTELVVVSIGLQYQLINQLGFTILVLTALITTVLTGPALQAWLHSHAKNIAETA